MILSRTTTKTIIKPNNKLTNIFIGGVLSVKFSLFTNKGCSAVSFPEIELSRIFYSTKKREKCILVLVCTIFKPEMRPLV